MASEDGSAGERVMDADRKGQPAAPRNSAKIWPKDTDLPASPR